MVGIISREARRNQNFPGYYYFGSLRRALLCISKSHIRWKLSIIDLLFLISPFILMAPWPISPFLLVVMFLFYLMNFCTCYYKASWLCSAFILITMLTVSQREWSNFFDFFLVFHVLNAVLSWLDARVMFNLHCKTWSTITKRSKFTLLQDCEYGCIYFNWVGFLFAHYIFFFSYDKFPDGTIGRSFMFLVCFLYYFSFFLCLAMLRAAVLERSAERAQ
jgi:hypothetical protein